MQSRDVFKRERERKRERKRGRERGRERESERARERERERDACVCVQPSRVEHLVYCQLDSSLQVHGSQGKGNKKLAPYTGSNDVLNSVMMPAPRQLKLAPSQGQSAAEDRSNWGCSTQTEPFALLVGAGVTTGKIEHFMLQVRQAHIK